MVRVVEEPWAGIDHVDDRSRLPAGIGQAGMQGAVVQQHAIAALQRGHRHVLDPRRGMRPAVRAEPDPGRPGPGVDVDQRHRRVDRIDRQARAEAVGEQMRQVAMNMLNWRARMRYDGREIGQMEIIAEQRTQKFEQARIGEHIRLGKAARHRQRDIAACTAYAEKPVRRRSVRLDPHRDHIERAELREIFAMHRLDGGGREHPAQQDAAVLVEGGMRRRLGFGSKLPGRDLLGRDLNNPIHRQLLHGRRAIRRWGSSRPLRAARLRANASASRRRTPAPAAAGRSRGAHGSARAACPRGSG